MHPEAEVLRTQLLRELPRASMSEMAVAIATARVFPAMKRAMGHSTSCELSAVG